MPAAVPAYLKEFSEAPPGHRFSLYYAGWNDDWSKPKSGVVPVLDALKKLPNHSIHLLAAICARQNAAADVLSDQVLALPCISTAPFATGLGNEHPLENGFAFLTPYGLPYLAGSGVKGVIRKATEELASGEWGESGGWNDDSIRTLFGPGEEDPAKDSHPQQGALRFWDVLPILHKDEMSVEIMTPHHGEYYQGKHSPHNSENPTTISFLAVPAKSQFTFFVECNAALLRDEALRQRWRDLLEAAFEHAGKWLGFGAKTAVGYGRMKLDKKAAEETQQRNADSARLRATHAAEAIRMASLLPEELALEPARASIATFRDAFEAEKAKGKYKAGSPIDEKRLTFFKLAGGWTSPAVRAEAVQLLREVIKWSDWPGNKDRKQQFKDWLTALESGSI